MPRTDDAASVIDELQRQDAMHHERARTLLNKKQLTERDHTDARKLVREFVQHRKLKSYEELSVNRVSLTALGQWLAGKYKGDNDHVARGCLRLIDKEFRGLDIDVPFEFIKTGICTRIIKAMMDAAANRDATMIFGPSGLGKTVACKLASHKAIPHAIHIECTQGGTSPGAFVRMLARRTGAPRTTGPIGDVQEDLIRHLRATAPFLMIDEGHYLGAKCLNILRDLVKQCEIGMALVGTIDLDRAVDDATEFHGQWSRLIVIRYDIKDEHTERGEGFFSTDELDRFCKAQRFAVTPKGIEQITQYANIPGWGGLGQAKNVLRKAELIADGNIHPSHIRGAVEQTHGRHYSERAVRQIKGMSERATGRGSRTRSAA